MECVPNFSEGRDKTKIEKIVDAFRGKEGVKLLDYSSDSDHNRSVITVVGEPDTLKEAVLDAIGWAVELIDLTQHQGQHPRMGAVDVVPFIPIKNVTMEEAIACSKRWQNLLPKSMDFRYSCMRSRLRHRIGRTWPRYVKGSLKVCRKR